MKNEIQLIKNNQNRDWDDLEWLNEFYEFLQGNVPEGMTLGRGHGVKLSKNKSFTIILYLQEHLSVFPDHIEKCSECGQLYDSYSTGFHSEKTGKFYCSGCDSGDFD